MRGSSQASGGSEGSFTEGALSFLRSTVASASKESRKATKPTGKAFQTAHDSSGWDRKARWQRAFNLARDKMGVQGMDASVDKWGAGLREPEGADRLGGSAQPARRGSSLASGGIALSGAPGTIAELRTPVALKEHLKRGKGAREAGLQLVTLEAGSSCLDMPLSEQAAAAMVAQFEQRRQMLGAPLSPGRPALTPADRALKAWTNAGPTAPTASHPNASSTSSSSMSSSASTSASAQAQISTATGGDSGGSSNAGGIVVPLTSAGVAAAAAAASPVVIGAAAAATNRFPGGVATCSTNSESPAGSAGGGGGGSFSSCVPAGGSGRMILRRHSESGGVTGMGAAGGSFGAGGDGGASAPLKRACGSVTESIVSRTPQRLESGSMHRPVQESHPFEGQAPNAGEAAVATPMAMPQETRGSVVSRQSSGVLSAALVAPAAAAPVSPSGQAESTAGGWVPIVATPGSDAASGGGGGALRPTRRPSSASVRLTQPSAWLPPAAEQGSAAGGDDFSAPAAAPAPAAAAATATAAPSPFMSSLTSVPATAQPQSQSQLPAQRQSSPVLPALQVPPSPLPPSLAQERSCSPPRLLGPRGGSVPFPSSQSNSASATGGGVTEPLIVRRLLSPMIDAASPTSPGLSLAATSPCGSGGGALTPAPPASSWDSTSAFATGLRRPRPRASITGDGSGSGAATGGGIALPGTSSGPLPLRLHTGWAVPDAWTIPEGLAAAAPAPAPSRLVMHPAPASPPSSFSPTSLNGYRRATASTPGFGSQVANPQTSSSPPLSLRHHAAAQPATPNTPSPSPPSSSPAGASYRRASMPTTTVLPGTHSGGGAVSGGAARAAGAAAAAAPPPHSPPQARPAVLQQQQQQQLQPIVSAAPVRQPALKPMGAGGTAAAAATIAHRRLTDDGGGHAGGRGAPAIRAGGQRATPVSDAVLAGLRAVAVEVADELSREAEVAAMTRQALVAQQRSRLRASDSGRPRHISLPGDPWRKWG